MGGTHRRLFQTPSSQFPICNIIFFFNPQRASAVVMLDHIGGSIPMLCAAGASSRAQRSASVARVRCQQSRTKETRARCVGSRSVSSVQARTKSRQISYPIITSAGGSFFNPIQQVYSQQRLNDCGQVHVAHCTDRIPPRVA